MALGLDLSQSDAKIARARVHVDALKREILHALNDRKPYTARLSKIDRKSGWCSASFATGDLSEYGLGAIVGDVIQNLRAALDYIVTALADASNVSLSNRHQFPIFNDEAEYLKTVGTALSVKKGGPLGGIVHGLEEIWDLQPFNRTLLSHPEHDVLSGIQRFSNADKHRALVAFFPVIGEHNARWVFDAGRPVKIVNIAARPDWASNQEYEVSRIRFSQPYPRRYGYEAQLSVNVHFGTPATGNQLFGIAVEENSFGAACDRLTKIVEKFKNL